jgi:RNA-directed DNA polymerase
LELHPKKTQIVYCKDANRTGDHPAQRFDFLGYTFRPRRSMNRKRSIVPVLVPTASSC